MTSIAKCTLNTILKLKMKMSWNDMFNFKMIFILLFFLFASGLRFVAYGNVNWIFLFGNYWEKKETKPKRKMGYYGSDSKWAWYLFATLPSCLNEKWSENTAPCCNSKDGFLVHIICICKLNHRFGMFFHSTLLQAERCFDSNIELIWLLMVVMLLRFSSR